MQRDIQIWEINYLYIYISYNMYESFNVYNHITSGDMKNIHTAKCVLSPNAQVDHPDKLEFWMSMY